MKLSINEQKKYEARFVSKLTLHSCYFMKESEEQSGISQLNRKVSDVKTST